MTSSLLHRGAYDPGLANEAIGTREGRYHFSVDIMEAWSFYEPVWERPGLKAKGHRLFIENLLCARGCSYTIPQNPRQRVVSTRSPLY